MFIQVVFNEDSDEGLSMITIKNLYFIIFTLLRSAQTGNLFKKKDNYFSLDNNLVVM